MGVLDEIPTEWDLLRNKFSDQLFVSSRFVIRRNIPASEPAARSMRVISEDVYIL